MKCKVNDRKDEDGGRPEPRDVRSQHRAGNRQPSGCGSAGALSSLEMLERPYQLPVRPEGLEKR